MANRYVYAFDELAAAQAASGNDWERVRGLLGGKGANLAEMTRIGLPVPPGFTVTTEACNAYLAAGEQFPQGLWDEELAALRARLLEAGSLVGESDHGVSKSLYAKDPDGIEFEVMWAVPRADWPATVGTQHLDLDAALARWPQLDTAGAIASD